MAERAGQVNHDEGQAVEMRSFTISMLSTEIEISLPASASVEQLVEQVEEQTGKDGIRLVPVAVDLELTGSMKLRDVPTELAAEVLPPILVLHVGSTRVLAGFAGQDAPALVFPTVVGHPRTDTPSQTACVVGEEALEKQGALVLQCAVERGIATNWEDMQAIWRHAFIGLDTLTCEGRTVLMSEPVLNPKSNRERMVQLLFEDLKFRSVYIACSQVLCLYAAGRTTGVVLDIGEDVRYCVPIYEGYTLPHAVDRYDRGAGRELTDTLIQALANNGMSVTTLKERTHVAEVKEKICYVLETRPEGDSEIEAEPCSVDLPGQSPVELSHDRYLVPELLFDPYRFYQGDFYRAGLQNQVHDVITRVDCDIRADLYQNVILAGGPSLLAGLPERLLHELRPLAPFGLHVKVVSPPERDVSSWVGGSILASLSTFQEMWITEHDYEEHGPPVVHKKCF